jgi:anti-sigma factor RsiW
MCPDGTVLSAYLDEELEAPWRASVEEHLATCRDCAAAVRRLQALRAELRSEAEPDFVDAMARTRNALASYPPPRAGRWRPVSVPLPVAALAACLVVLLGCALVLTVLRPWDVSTVRITATPTGIRQFEVSGDPEDVRKILEVLNSGAVDRSVTIEIPKDFRFTAFGEPEIRPALQRSSP